MDPLAFFAVLFAALLHAGWNASMKVNLDRSSMFLLLTGTQGAMALCLLWAFPAPDPAAWGLIALSGALHAGYNLFLIQAYAHGDLSQAYPVARGSAPMIVALVSVLALSVPLGLTGWAAILCISAGVLWIGLVRPGGVGLSRKGLAYALGTACFTAGYTLVDGIGVRLAGTASGFILWMFIVLASIMVAHALIMRGPTAFLVLRPVFWKGVAAGAMSLGSYWIAAWAFTRAPIALVAALRETSILFALIIAAVFLNERVLPARWLAAGLIVTGIALMRV